MIDIYFLQSFLDKLPWQELVTLFTGGVAGGGIGKLLSDYWQHRREKRVNEREASEGLRDELRLELDDLRTRLQKTEDEIITWRKRHFDLQEKYYELKREHKDAQKEIESLRAEIKIYKQD